MLISKSRFFHGLLGLGLTLPAAAFADPVVPASQPLFLAGTVKHNLLLAIDDSGSMDFETLMASNDGALWLGDNGSFLGDDGTVNDKTSLKYTYLFPNGRNGTYDGRRINNSDNHFAVPPIKAFAFARNSVYNKSYYDPNVEYEPWASYGGFEFDDTDPTSAPWDIMRSSRANLDLTSDLNTSTKIDDDWGFDIEDSDMPCTDAGGPCNSTGTKHYTYFPAHYYVIQKSGTYTYTGSGIGVTRNCAADPIAAHYREFFADTSKFSGVDAIGPKGECLKRVEIKPSETTYSYVDRKGNAQSRSYDEEITNFANWFTYYRRRHQAMRGGLGGAFQGIGGINAGLFWINDLEDVTMYDMDDDEDVNTFLDRHYRYVSSGGTPNRQALAFAGEQLKRTDAGAPISYECQKNFTLLFTDGFSTTATINGIGNEDENAGAPYADSNSSNLGDIAYKYYTENPRPNLDTGKVKTPAGCNASEVPASLDCNTNLHMNTYTVGLGASGTIYGVTHNSVADAYVNPPTWPATGERDKRMIDDLYHAAVNGRGDIFNAQSPVELKTELSAALRDIIDSIGNSSSVTFNTGTLNEESLVYSASFNSTGWSGDLEARELDASSGDVSETAVWQASEILDAKSPSERVILTYSNVSNDGVPFRWNTSTLDSGQIEDLSKSPSGTADSLGPQRLNFIRGSRAGEGTTFRNRSTVLGDIVHSTPVYVGKPRLTWPDSGSFGVADNRYSKFRNITAANRTPVIYVGANDGMLHGFKAVEDPTDGGGDELLAYIPRSVYSTEDRAGLNYLTLPDYRHRYYVDLSPQVVDAYIKTSPSGSEDWRSVLVGGLRNGGVGFFALDVTNPGQFSESNASDLVLWEFTEDDDARLNYALTEPTIGMMNNGRWAMIFGNGPANGATTEDGMTGVFILYMDGGLNGSWDEGSDYEFISLGATGGLSMTQPVDLNGDSVIDRIYGGDREGNLWVVDVSSNKGSSWESAYRDGNGINANALPLFTAIESGVPQPIMTRPLVVRNVVSPVGTEGTNGEDYMVYFGTGRYFSDGDASDTSQQSFYGIWDRGEAGLDRDNLVEQSISVTSRGGRQLRQSSGASIDWGDTEGNDGRDYGWYMDLPETGERVVNRAQIRGKIVFFETFTPSQSPCDGGGSGWLMSVAIDGSNPDEPVFDANNDGVINSDDADDSGDNYVGEKIDGMSTGGSAFLDDFQYLNEEVPDKREVNTGDSGDRTGRLGWQELLAP